MDTSFKYTGLCSNEAPSVVGRAQEEAAAAGGDGELNGLLRRRRGGMSRGRRKPELKVQRNDEKGKELARVHETSLSKYEDGNCCFKCTAFLLNYPKNEKSCTIL